MLMKMGKIFYEILIFLKLIVVFLNGILVGGGCEFVIVCDFCISVIYSEMGFI